MVETCFFNPSHLYVSLPRMLLSTFHLISLAHTQSALGELAAREFAALLGALSAHAAGRQLLRTSIGSDAESAAASSASSSSSQVHGAK